MTPAPPSSDDGVNADETLRWIRKAARAESAESAQDRHRTKVRRSAQRRTRGSKG